MRLVIISDTHGMHDQLDIPAGDVFIHCGDFLKQGTLEETEEFNEFLGTLKHRHKLVIAGNHDFCFEREAKEAEALITHAAYLRDSAITIDGIKFYGSPWQPWFFDFAFNLQRGAELKAKWDLIEPDTQVLITHTPPHGIGDEVANGENVGCEELKAAVNTLQPQVHIFGHIHEGYGVTSDINTTFINASSCDAQYQPINPAIVFDL